MKTYFITTLASLLAACASLQAETQTLKGLELKQSFDVKSGGRLTIEADRGSITISSSKSDHVDVQIVRKTVNASQEEAESLLEQHLVQVDHDGGDVAIRAKSKQQILNGSWLKRARLDVRYTVSVPEKYNLTLSTAGGDIQCDAVEGEVQAKTSGGSVKLGKIKGPVRSSTAGGNITVEGAIGSLEAKSSGGKIQIGTVDGNAIMSSAGGSISLDSATGRTEAKASGGNVRLGNIQGDLEAHSAGGSIQIDEVKGHVTAKASGGNVTIGKVEGSIQASSAGGSVTASLVKSPQEDCKLSASGGGVTMTLGKDVDVDVDARASGGSVRSELPIGKPGKNKSRLQGALNKGGARLDLSSAGGSIHIKEMN